MNEVAYRNMRVDQFSGVLPERVDGSRCTGQLVRWPAAILKHNEGKELYLGTVSIGEGRFLVKEFDYPRLVAVTMFRDWHQRYIDGVASGVVDPDEEWKALPAEEKKGIETLRGLNIIPTAKEWREWHAGQQQKETGKAADNEEKEETMGAKSFKVIEGSKVDGWLIEQGKQSYIGTFPIGLGHYLYRRFKCPKAMAQTKYLEWVEEKRAAIEAGELDAEEFGRMLNRNDRKAFAQLQREGIFPTEEEIAAAVEPAPSGGVEPPALTLSEAVADDGGAAEPFEHEDNLKSQEDNSVNPAVHCGETANIEPEQELGEPEMANTKNSTGTNNTAAENEKVHVLMASTSNGTIPLKVFYDGEKAKARIAELEQLNRILDNKADYSISEALIER